jgi:hypothetical protein
LKARGAARELEVGLLLAVRLILQNEGFTVKTNQTPHGNVVPFTA